MNYITGIVFPLTFLLTAMDSNSKESIYRLNGFIDSKTILPVIESINSGTQTLVVNSQGGHEVSAIKLANIIADKEVSIIVDGVCMSACASYIFAAAKRREVRQNSVVSFHISSFAGINFLELAKFSKTLHSDIITANSAAISLYQKLNISTDVFIDGMKMLQPNCIDARIHMKEHRPIIYTSHNTWVPSREYFHQVGMNFEGFWPDSPAEAFEIITKGEGNGFSINFGGTMSQIRAYKLPYKVGHCTDLLEKQ